MAMFNSYVSLPEGKSMGGLKATVSGQTLVFKVISAAEAHQTHISSPNHN